MASGGVDSSRHHWSRCLPSQPAQDFLHSSRWWRSWHGPHWSQVSPGPFSSHSPCDPYGSLPQLQVRRAELWHLGVSALWLSPHLAHLLCLYFHDGITWADTGVSSFPEICRCCVSLCLVAFQVTISCYTCASHCKSTAMTLRPLLAFRAARFRHALLIERSPQSSYEVTIVSLSSKSA